MREQVWTHTTYIHTNTHQRNTSAMTKRHGVVFLNMKVRIGLLQVNISLFSHQYRQTRFPKWWYRALVYTNIKNVDNLPLQAVEGLFLLRQQTHTHAHIAIFPAIHVILRRLLTPLRHEARCRIHPAVRSIFLRCK